LKSEARIAQRSDIKRSAFAATESKQGLKLESEARIA
jgi:hypothetical protein